VAVVSEIFLERETANDEDGVVVAVHVDSGQAVKSGQPLFDVEHSKATMEICASVDGFLLHELAQGTSVTFGSRIACVVDAIDPDGSLPAQQTKAPLEALRVSPSAGSAAAPAPAAPAGGRQPKLSRAAAKLAEQFGLTSADFAVDLVSTADVRSKIGAGRTPAQRPPLRGGAASLTVEALSNVGRAERISPRKSEEISLLQNGPGNTTQSTLGEPFAKRSDP
jgi:pyruvate/2-oxoglutarate dehydrogenase complex dihydrolipoamide acyltransferase (E2) component